MDEKLAPPWTMFEWAQGSMGWRMGPGESCMHEWMAWFKSLSDNEQKDYIAKNPTPDGWILFYEMVIETDDNKRSEIIREIRSEREKWIEAEFDKYLALKDIDLSKALKHLKLVVTYNGKYKDALNIYNSHVEKG